jgi:prepilin-type N-terminal cleavage/methylation domain-containing protein
MRDLFQRIRRPREGYTLAELLIVVALIALILMIVLWNLRNQVSRGFDSNRKTDLNNIKKAFEEFYNDNQTFPQEPAIFTCGSSDGELGPYLKSVPCDPTTKKPYLYVIGRPTRKDGYVLCAILQNKSDPDIVRMGCSPTEGCGWLPGYNYCLAAGAMPIAAETGGGVGGGGIYSSPTPSGTPAPGQWACTPRGDCNAYGDPVGAECPYTYAAKGCMYAGTNQCLNPDNRCKYYY